MEPEEFEREKQLVTHWLNEFIVGLNLCPFAKKPLVNGQVRLTCITEKKRASILEKFLVELNFLDNNKATDTSLLIFPLSLGDFYQYLTVLDLCSELLETSGYEGIYQLASFHPNYLFEGEDINDASHFTNRAPFPIIHILREQSIEQVLKTYKDPENIPMDNIKKMRDLGSQYLRNTLSKMHSE